MIVRPSISSCDRLATLRRLANDTRIILLALAMGLLLIICKPRSEVQHYVGARWQFSPMPVFDRVSEADADWRYLVTLAHYDWLGRVVKIERISKGEHYNMLIYEYGYDCTGAVDVQFRSLSREGSVIASDSWSEFTPWSVWSAIPFAEVQFLGAALILLFLGRGRAKLGRWSPVR